jgi:hypothetical protein
MQNSKTQIRFITHNVHIEVVGDLIRVFKYCDHGCDFDTFTVDEQMEASDYIMQPLPQIHYRVCFPSEQ